MHLSIIIPIILVWVSSFFPFKVEISSNFPVVSLTSDPFARDAPPLMHAAVTYQLVVAILPFLFQKSVSQMITSSLSPLSNCISSTEYLHFGSVSLPSVQYPKWSLFPFFLLIFLIARCNTNVGCVFQSNFGCEYTIFYSQGINEVVQ